MIKRHSHLGFNYYMLRDGEIIMTISDYIAFSGARQSIVDDRVESLIKANDGYIIKVVESVTKQEHYPDKDYSYGIKSFTIVNWLMLDNMMLFNKLLQIGLKNYIE